MADITGNFAQHQIFDAKWDVVALSTFCQLSMVLCTRLWIIGYREFQDSQTSQVVLSMNSFETLWYLAINRQRYHCVLCNWHPVP